MYKVFSPRAPPPRATASKWQKHWLNMGAWWSRIPGWTKPKTTNFWIWWRSTSARGHKISTKIRKFRMFIPNIVSRWEPPLNSRNEPVITPNYSKPTPHKTNHKPLCHHPSMPNGDTSGIFQLAKQSNHASPMKLPPIFPNLKKPWTPGAATWSTDAIQLLRWPPLGWDSKKIFLLRWWMEGSTSLLPLPVTWLNLMLVPPLLDSTTILISSPFMANQDILGCLLGCELDRNSLLPFLKDICSFKQVNSSNGWLGDT